jgi:uncharacterized protein YjiS (DUF1127 family)
MNNTIPPPCAAVAGCNRRVPEESMRFIPILIPADHLPDMTQIAAHMGAMMIKVLALGWALSLGPAWRWLKRDAERRRATAALLASDPHILRDIGIERENVLFMVYGQPGAIRTIPSTTKANGARTGFVGFERPGLGGLGKASDSHGRYSDSL